MNSLNALRLTSSPLSDNSPRMIRELQQKNCLQGKAGLVRFSFWNLVSAARLVILCAFLAPLLCMGADWPQWRGPNRDGISQETGWLTDWPAAGPKRIWEGKVGVGYSSFAVSGNRVITMGNVNDTDRVVCFDAATGRELWKHEYACEAKDPNGFHGTRSTPTIEADRVYTLSRHGHMFCLDAGNGTVRWSLNLVKDLGGREPTQDNGNQGWGYSGSALIEKNWVLVEAGGTEGASVVALDKLTGKVVWKHGNDGAGYSSLVAFDYMGERLLAQFAAGHLVLRRMKDGSEVMRQPWKTSYAVNAATPIVADDHIFIASGYGSGCGLYRITPSGFQEVWRNKDMKNHVNSCVLVNGFLYGFDESELKCLDWKTGEAKWASRAYGKGSLMSAAGKLLVYSPSGRLGLVEATPEGFKESAGFQVLQGRNAWAHPVLAHGRIFVRGLDEVVAFDVAR